MILRRTGMRCHPARGAAQAANRRVGGPEMQRQERSSGAPPCRLAGGAGEKGTLTRILMLLECSCSGAGGVRMLWLLGPVAKPTDGPNAGAELPAAAARPASCCPCRASLCKRGLRAASSACAVGPCCRLRCCGLPGGSARGASSHSASSTGQACPQCEGPLGEGVAARREVSMAAPNRRADGEMVVAAPAGGRAARGRQRAQCGGCGRRRTGGGVRPRREAPQLRTEMEGLVATTHGPYVPNTSTRPQSRPPSVKTTRGYAKMRQQTCSRASFEM